MIEPMQLPERGGVSVVEEALRGLLEERGAWPVFWFVDDGSHAGGGLWAAPRAATPAGADPVLDEDLPPAVVAFAGLLEAGAGHLAAAKAAHVESCRQAAVQARALAAFAAARPGTLLDRPDQRRQPVLPVPPPPPAQPPGARLAAAPPGRRRPGMDHPGRRPDHHPPARLRHRRPPTTRTRTTADHPRTGPRTTTPTRHHRPRPRAVLTRSSPLPAGERLRSGRAPLTP
jgi:hypothetical protein